MTQGSREQSFFEMKCCSFIVASCAIVLLVACGRFEGTFRFLREPPKAELIPGVYVLDRSAYSEKMLSAWGYSDLSARISLKSDQTFEIQKMPDCWLDSFGRAKDGYDSFRGTWSITKSSAVYAITLWEIEGWTDDSTAIRENRRIGGFHDALTITKLADGYGLAVAIAAGDNGYLYFKRL